MRPPYLEPIPTIQLIKTKPEFKFLHIAAIELVLLVLLKLVNTTLKKSKPRASTKVAILMLPPQSLFLMA